MSQQEEHTWKVRPDFYYFTNLLTICNSGLRVAQVRLLFNLPAHLRTPAPGRALPEHLAYIEWFTPFRAAHPHSQLRSVSRSSQDRSAAAEIIPVSDIVSSCHLLPRFGTHYRAGWSTDTVLEECPSFFLNPYISVGTFYEHHAHLF